MARKKSKPEPANATLSIAAVVDCIRSWDAFQDKHRDWLETLDVSRPLYCLPEVAIVALERQGQRSPHILDGSAASAERALTELCRQANAVGFWDGRPISYRVLVPIPESPNLDGLGDLGWSSLQMAAANLLIGRADATNERLQAVAGWLLTEPNYLLEVNRLSTRWHDLPRSHRPSFPLKPAFRVQVNLPDSVPATQSATEFVSDFRTFCDRWGLVGLATWDLPEPQGPLVPSPLPPGAPATPLGGISVTIPMHFHVQDDDAFLRAIVAEQRNHVQDRGLDLSYAGLPHYRAYAQILQIIHLEQTILQRYCRGDRRKGIIGRIETALTRLLVRSEANVRKLRKAIVKCQAGQRSMIRWLRAKI